MRLWPGSEFCSKLIWSYTGVDQTQMHHKLFTPHPPHAPPLVRLIIDPCGTWAQCWTPSSPSLLCPSCRHPPEFENITSENIFQNSDEEMHISVFEFWPCFVLLHDLPPFHQPPLATWRCSSSQNLSFQMLSCWSAATYPSPSHPGRRTNVICQIVVWLPTSFSISAHFAFFFSFLAFRYSFRPAASSFLFFVEFWGSHNSYIYDQLKKFTWAWTVVVPLEGSLSNPSVDTKIPLES